jgi:hypothetical protein
VKLGAASLLEGACCPIATQGTRLATHRTTAYLLVIEILLVAVIVVAVPIILRRLADDCANARTRSAGNQSAFDPTAKHCTQRGPGRSSDQSTLTRTNTALIAVIVVLVISVVVVASTIISPVGAPSCSVVELVVVIAPILGE